MKQAKASVGTPSKELLDSMKRRGVKGNFTGQSRQPYYYSWDLEAGDRPSTMYSTSVSSRSSYFVWCKVHLQRILAQRHNRWLLLLVFVSVVLFIHSWFPTLPSNLSSKHHSEKYSGAGGISNIQLTKFPPSVRELDELNSHLSNVDVDDLLLWSHGQFTPRGGLVQITSFGPSGLVILHKLHTLGLLPTVPVLSVDTLHLFPETYDFINTIEGHFMDMNLQIFRPKGFDTQEQFDETYGPDLWKKNPDRYAYLSKVEPMLRALEVMDASAWITGRRRSQGGERSNLAVFELDNLDETKRVKINPLANWSYDDIWTYIRNNNIPYNPLHDKGYKSIGDVMTTRPVKPDADERSGRFIGLNKTECGMHSHLEKIKKMREEAERDNREFVMPSLSCVDCIEVDTSTFDDLVLNNQKTDVLLEFYSPLCGSCQDMAPKYERIAHKLASIPNIEVARFDITENDIPKSGEDAGMEVVATPTLYLVQHSPLRVDLYEGNHDVGSILEWLEWKTSYIKVSSLPA